MDDINYSKIINIAIENLFKNARMISYSNLSLVSFISKTIRYQKRAAKKRSKMKELGYQVPPYLIISVTNKCNLQCKGCYSNLRSSSFDLEITSEKLSNIIAQSIDLGISIILLAGGEPLIKKDIIDIAGNFPRIIFPVFTNGLLINDQVVNKFKKFRNIVPVISIEGHINETDSRRGIGIYKILLEKITKFHQNKLFFGLSITVTKTNLREVISKDFVNRFIEIGCKLFFYIEYIPIVKSTEHLIISNQERKQLFETLHHFREIYKGLFISFPGDEGKYGGCMSSGRGFAHVSASGDVEPCPFAPYSDSNLNKVSLKDALRSDFLRKIRENREKLDETKGGCALWENREWVKSLLK